LLLAIGLSGCATYPDISQSRSPCRSEPGGWCSFIGEAAADAWPYAVAATNAYQGDDDIYTDLGPSLVMVDRLEIAKEDADTGFDYQIFERIEPATAAIGNSFAIPTGEVRKVERILAFRGTDFGGFSDIYYGTLKDDQIELALKYFDLERARPEFTDGVEWVVTGHSLGGALATEVSIKYPEVRAYMFNTSPFYRGDALTNDMHRLVINERGEVLRRFAKYRVPPAADVFTLNCAPSNGTFTKHKIRPLSDCIAWIAAYRDRAAFKLVQDNAVRKPMVECGRADKAHPGAGYRPTEPCVHIARKKDDEE
jgi:hypothetical protein